MKLLLLLWLALAFSASAATRYVDSAATGANNGTSWANAWTSMNSVSVSGGDIVYISGGPSGTSQNYRFNSIPGYDGIWLPPSGSTGNPVTYKIGQDSLHNGTAIFLGYGAQSGGGYWLGYQVSPRPHDIIISGDAGDGLQHFALSGYNIIGVCNDYTNVRISYVNFGEVPYGIDFLGCSGIEFDHNYVYITGLDADHFSGATFAADEPWGANSIHHCTIYVPEGASGIGPDILQWNGNGMDIYNNVLYGYAAAYTGGQHADGWQGQGGKKIRIYNNLFYGAGNYAIYGDLTGLQFEDLRIYNNIIINSGGGVVVGADAGSDPTRYFTNVIIANNIVDCGSSTSGQPLAFGNTPRVPAITCVFSGCQVANNIAIQGSGAPSAFNFTGWSPTTESDNVEVTPATAATLFTSYTALSASSNFRPLVGATSLIGQGTDLSSYFTTDKAGVTRGALWDIGAYEYLQAGTVTISGAGATSFSGSGSTTFAQ